MTGDDLIYIRRLIADKVVAGPVLELGAGYGGYTSRQDIEAAGLSYFGTDMGPSPGVDFVADFEKSEDMKNFTSRVPFGSIFILNVLEHTFDPIRILDNAATLLKPGGTLVTITPAIWPLHNYPMDAWRMLPNFFEEYAKRRGITLEKKYFEYVGQGPVANYVSADSAYEFPRPYKPGIGSFVDRAVHRVFNTFGRSMFHGANVSIGAVFRV